MFCTKCGTQNADDVRFCTACGTPVAAADAPATSPAAPAPAHALAGAPGACPALPAPFAANARSLPLHRIDRIRAPRRAERRSGTRRDRRPGRHNNFRAPAALCRRRSAAPPRDNRGYTARSRRTFRRRPGSFAASSSPSLALLPLAAGRRLSLVLRVHLFAHAGLR